jgi:carboxymethylenebutenolidase
VCHSDDSRPPAPPALGRVAEHGPVELTAADGTVFAAYRAMPGDPNGRNMVILPDVRGLHPRRRSSSSSTGG